MIDQVVAQELSEGADLDFKSQLQPASGLAATDFPKDLAALANSGGGSIVYGVTETDKRATGRRDVELTEGHERTLRQVAISAITPPISDLRIEALGSAPQRCVVVTVRPSTDGPHLIFRQDYFGAPLRVDADTFWMKERQIEAMYRARFDRSGDLDTLYARTVQSLDASERAWLVAVAMPRTPAAWAARMTRDESSAIFLAAETPAVDLASSTLGVHPLTWLDRSSPRPGFRSWRAPSVASESAPWRAAEASGGHTGSVTFATAVGGRRIGDNAYLLGDQIAADAIEYALVDTLATILATARHLGTTDYDLQIGIAYGSADTPDPVFLFAIDPMLFGHVTSAGTESPVHFSPVRASIPTVVDDGTFRAHAHEIALDCLNQGGIPVPAIITPGGDG